MPITPTIREILWSLQGHHPDLVFTYVASRTIDGRIKGERYPFTYESIKMLWQRLRKTAGVTGFRLHDFRHDFGTKLLRKTGNLKLVQRAMNHSNIKSTVRYAHVLDDDIAEAMESMARDRKSPKNSPTRGREAG